MGRTTGLVILWACDQRRTYRSVKIRGSGSVFSVVIIIVGVDMPPLSLARKEELPDF